MEGFREPCYDTEGHLVPTGSALKDLVGRNYKIKSFKLKPIPATNEDYCEVGRSSSNHRSSEQSYAQ
ncbi:hypothetical protein FRX31_014998, partial [Thalictrum thalictroides]